MAGQLRRRIWRYGGGACLLFALTYLAHRWTFAFGFTLDSLYFLHAAAIPGADTAA